MNQDVQCSIVGPSFQTSQVVESVQNGNIEEAQKLFCQLPSNEAKQDVVLDSQVKPNQAELLLSNDICIDNIEVVNDEVIQKINSTCDEDCQRLKKRAIAKMEEVADMADKAFLAKEIYLKKELSIIKKSEKATKEIASFVKGLHEATVDPIKVKSQLQTKIQNAYDNNYLSEKQYKQMKKAVGDATSFDPLWTTSFRDITANTNRELRIRKNDYISKSNIITGTRKKLKRKMKGIVNGIKSSSKSVNIEKSFHAGAHVGSAIGKFVAASDSSMSDLEKGLKITSGVLDVTNAIATFLPPPASLVTSTFSGIFNMFGLGGDPSNQEVIDEIKKGFEEQKKFISQEFEKQNQFIMGEFDKQNQFIFGQFQNQQDFISGQFRNQILQEFKEINADVAGLLDEISEKMYFLQSFGGVVNGDAVADSIRDEINVLGKTHEVSKLQNFIRQRCLPELNSCSTHDLKGSCLFLISTLTTIEKYRDVTLLNLINLLEPTTLRQLNKGYLKVHEQRKHQIKSWLNDNILGSNVRCILINKWQSNHWKSNSDSKRIINFMTYIDPSFTTKLDGSSLIDECSQLNFRAGQHCDGKSFHSIMSI